MLFRALLIFLLITASVSVQAATVISVDINRARLEWTWVIGTGGAATTFTVKCGSTTGAYTKLTTVPATTFSVPVATVITGIGNWFCVVTASNEFGESGPSNEINFAAGIVPSAPTGLILKAQ